MQPRLHASNRPPKHFHAMRGVFGAYNDSATLVKPRESIRRSTPRPTQPIMKYDDDIDVHPLAFFASDPPLTLLKISDADSVLRVHLQTIETSLKKIRAIRHELEYGRSR
ncbi:hypothetical protein THRCLA_23396 [Thraustotheca clavata]|uniref:Uncharacterized protein n=1 Tax=Thraustotheca clavata TaxID=74557 RepID=A0A1V9Y6J3_9STRA|nr:hypothetical protein THRCLA_23396 [Thraustotheca clavata]